MGLTGQGSQRPHARRSTPCKGHRTAPPPVMGILSLVSGATGFVFFCMPITEHLLVNSVQEYALFYFLGGMVVGTAGCMRHERTFVLAAAGIVVHVISAITWWWYMGGMFYFVVGP